MQLLQRREVKGRSIFLEKRFDESVSKHSGKLGGLVSNTNRLYLLLSNSCAQFGPNNIKDACGFLNS